MSTVDLSKFIAENERLKHKRIIPWADRKALINEQFPSTEQLDWYAALKDDGVFVRIIEDILRVSLADTTRSGPRRPKVEREQAKYALRELFGQGHTTQPFDRAFGFVIGTNSLTQVARKTGISRSRVHRLLRGESEPDVADMEKIAAAYGRDPSYFVEYRAAVVAMILWERLNSEPELASVAYNKLKAAA